MTTKAGQLQFKDIRQGKTIWVVDVLTRKGKLYAHCPVKAVLRKRPFKLLRHQGLWWFNYFEGCVTHIVQCNTYGIKVPDQQTIKNDAAASSGIFKSLKAAENYIERIGAEKVSALQLDDVNQALIDDFYDSLFLKRRAACDVLTPSA